MALLLTLIHTTTNTQAERTDEEKETVEKELDTARGQGLKGFEEALTFWAPDGSGKVLSWAEFQQAAAGAGREEGGLPHPKVCGLGLGWRQAAFSFSGSLFKYTDVPR